MVEEKHESLNPIDVRLEEIRALKDKRNKKKQRKIFWLLVIIFITTITLVVETYAWFVGISHASIEQFQIGVSTGEGIELSLNGEDWSNKITISEDALKGAYEGNTNSWPTKGLSPISSSGEFDTTASRLKLFEKSSITATAGGYRLMAARINNYGTDGTTNQLVSEQDGYIAFDLFIRNGTASHYDATYDADSNEDVYLTSDSTVASTASGAADYGIANSVRIGFFEIGRVAANTDVGVIKAISCNDTNTSVTDLCSIGVRSKTWNIWEPNDNIHDSNLISYFNKVCKKRTAAVTYGEPCTELTTTSKVNTYTVKDVIVSGDQVDVYDGINTYTESITNNKLVLSETFTDSVDKVADVDKKTSIFTLASNSVTKVRVYIYLEGQDIDNYDLIANSYQIKINFGFTKDKYNLNT